MSKKKSEFFIFTVKIMGNVELSEAISRIAFITDQFSVSRDRENPMMWEISWPEKRSVENPNTP